ncbi:hypothetical protein Cadr_000017588 [Camelus dromedarius]|uniref:Uncharacterized protein n=1 Tax=Camelus dromedarius TaxID=9838 RepID=A0A5N4DE78_CAMDR|nr:hypothetical protein Cadr_000017588 [Camelus dromedarius]
MAQGGALLSPSRALLIVQREGWVLPLLPGHLVAPLMPGAWMTAPPPGPAPALDLAASIIEQGATVPEVRQEGALRWELLSEAGLPHGSLATVCPSIWMEEERGPISLCPARTPRRPHPAPFSPPSHASALKCGPDNTGCLPST